MADSKRDLNLKLLDATAKNIAPTHPRAADSVGEAMPAIIEPSTRVISIRGGEIEIKIDFQAIEEKRSDFGNKFGLYIP